MRGGASGSNILSKLISEVNIPAVKYAVSAYFDTVASGEFEWILDLNEAGYSNEDIVNLLMESARPEPWVAANYDESGKFADETFPSIPIAEKSPATIYFPHQPHCLHKGPQDKLWSSVPQDVSIVPGFQVSLDFDKVEEVRRDIAELCGIAGIYPPGHQTSESGYADFHDGGCVSVGYGSGIYSPIKKKASFQPFHLFVVRQISKVVRCLFRALKMLQDGGLCCHNLTVLVAPPRPIYIMVASFPLQQVGTYLVQLERLCENYRARHEEIPRLWDSREFQLELKSCAQEALDILQMCRFESRFDEQNSVDDNSDMNLHLCAIACQLLAVNVISYAQAHTGDFQPHFVKEHLHTIRLDGYSSCGYPKLAAGFSYVQLACMSDLIGGKVLVVRLWDEERDEANVSDSNEMTTTDNNSQLPLESSIEDIIDTWGPGILIPDSESTSDQHTLYDQAFKSVLIAGGTLAHDPSSKSNIFGRRRPMYHWGRFHEPGKNGKSFNIRQKLKIGAITTQASCPLDSTACRKKSEPYLDHLGTEEDYWRLVERQVLLQGGQYVGLQVGNVYSKMKGRSLKDAVLDAWTKMPDFRILLHPWGLQVSLCTGVARRVPLKTLIEEPMLSYIDSLSLTGWDGIKSDVRKAFSGALDFMGWVRGLQGPERTCLIKVITFFLQVLKDTGLDREGKKFRMLWPDESSLSHAISLICSKSNLWARVLKDSPSCATFAAVTATCLEAPGHNCKKNAAPTWTGKGALLSTAVSRVLLPGTPKASDTSHWELRNGEQCWIEKAGGDIWVYTTKEPNSDTHLNVKINRLPKGLSIFRDWQVLRERQDATFEAENVVVFGTMA